MKFGKKLKDSMYAEWRFYYLDYDGLKRMLKERSGSKISFSESDEAAFVEAIEEESRRVFDFRDVKVGELTRHVQHLESVFANKYNNNNNSVNINENETVQFENEIGRVTNELSALAHFTRLNYTGFLKILKKHDKYTKFMLKPMFMVRFKNRPLYLENLDSLIYRLSKLYDLLRRNGVATGNLSSAPNSATLNFVRKTTKYWVHPDNVTELKCLILKRLPVFAYKRDAARRASAKDGSTDVDLDPAISSVYFDNNDLELYLGRLQKTEGAEAIRLRWYGSDPPNEEVFVERKTHREDWTGESSVKERFILKEKNVNSYLKGEYSLDKKIQKLRENIHPDDTKKKTQIDEMETLSREVQKSILDKKLKPMVRTFYNRTAFQLPNDARVRISLDTELAMMREDERTQGNWRRTDTDGMAYPFADLPASDVTLFPYAILEVKLQTQVGAEPPEWVTKMTEGHLVEAVPKFSKFIHGVSTLFESKVNLFPFWLPQMNIDIRKTVPSSTTLEEEDDEEEKQLNELIKRRQLESLKRETFISSSSSAQASTPLLKNGNTSNGNSDVIIEMRSSNSTAADLESYDESDSLLPVSLHARKKKPSKVKRFLSSIIPSSLAKKARASGNINNATALKKTEKKISLPVRIEPKVFFANERTFLSWIHFSIFLGGISTALLGLGGNTAKVSGLIFAAVSVAFAVYALFLYKWRANKIRNREAGPYDDQVGPIVLVIIFLVALGVTSIFSIIPE